MLARMLMLSCRDVPCRSESCRAGMKARVLSSVVIHACLEGTKEEGKMEMQSLNVLDGRYEESNRVGKACNGG